jgi:hypothetical protein
MATLNEMAHCHAAKALASILVAWCISTTATAMSYVATTEVAVRPSGKTTEEVIQQFESVASALGYSRGHFDGQSKPVVLEEKGTLRIYFLGSINRTTLKIDVARNDASATAHFEQFGVKVFTKAGREEYGKLIAMLIQAFGKDAVSERGTKAAAQQPNSALLTDAYLTALRASSGAAKRER